MKKSRGNYFFFINVSIRRLKEPVFACDADFFRVKLMNIFHAFHTHFHAFHTFHTFHTFSHIFFTHIFVTDISECVIMCDFFSRMCARKSVIKNMCVTLRETRVTRCVTPLRCNTSMLTGFFYFLITGSKSPGLRTGSLQIGEN